MNLTELQKQQLAFLEETVEFYQKNPRSKQGDKCLYYHPTLAGCAIGRHIPNKDICRNLDGVGGINRMSNTSYRLIPWSLRKLGKVFLSQMQDFHDSNDNWEHPKNLTGKVETLTYEGNSKIDLIKKRINDNHFTLNDKEEFE